jgi:hypothetical protein
VGAQASTGPCHRSGHTAVSSSRGSSDASDHERSNHSHSDQSAPDRGSTQSDHESDIQGQRDAHAADRDSSGSTGHPTTCSCSTLTQKRTDRDAATREPALAESNHPRESGSTHDSDGTQGSDGTPESGGLSTELTRTTQTLPDESRPQTANIVQADANSETVTSSSTASEPAVHGRSESATAMPTPASTLRSGGLAFTGGDWGAISALGAVLIGIGLSVTGLSRRPKRGQHFRTKTS